MKYLLWAAVIYLAWRWFSASRASRSSAPTAEAAGAAARGEDAEPMVKCAQCGVHLPLSEALAGSGEQFFCSESHRNLHHAA